MIFLRQKIINYVGFAKLNTYFFSKGKGEFFVKDKDGNRIVLQKNKAYIPDPVIEKALETKKISEAEVSYLKKNKLLTIYNIELYEKFKRKNWNEVVENYQKTAKSMKDEISYLIFIFSLLENPSNDEPKIKNALDVSKNINEGTNIAIVNYLEKSSKLVASFLNLKMQTEINIDYKLIKKMSNLAIKNIILLKGELELTKIEKEANNFKIRFLYEISPQSFQKHFTNMPLFNQTRKKK